LMHDGKQGQRDQETWKAGFHKQRKLILHLWLMIDKSPIPQPTRQM